MYLLFNTGIVNFVLKTDEAESIVLLIFALLRCLNRRRIRDGGVRQISYLGPAEVASFSSWDFNRSNKHDTF